MKLKLTWKKILCVVLSVIMVVGMITITGADKVEAAGETQWVSLSLKEVEASGAFVFNHNTLPDEYQGADDWSKTVIYEAQAYLDGSSQLKKVYLEFVGSTAYIWNSANFYDNGTMPGQSLVIPSAVQLKEYTYDGSAWNAVSNGKIMRMSEEMKLVNNSGTWTQVQPNIPEVSFEFVELDGDWLLSHSALEPEYEGDGDSIYYQYEAYVDDSDTLGTGFIEIYDDEVWIYNPSGFPDKTEPTTRFYIPEGTILRQCKSTSNRPLIVGGKALVLSSELKLGFNGETWVPITQAEVSLELESTNGNWSFTRSELQDKYVNNQGESIYYQYEAYVDGSDTLTKGLIEFYENMVCIENPTGFPNATAPTSKFYMPKGTVLKEYDCDNNALVDDGKELMLTEEVRVAAYDGEWREELILPEVPDGTPVVNFDFHSVYNLGETNKGWILTFDNSDLWGQQFATFSTLWIDGEQKDGTRIEFPTWTDVSSADQAYIYFNLFPDQAMPTTSFEIPQGATVRIENENKLYVVGQTLKVTFEDGEWKSNIKVVAPPEIIAPEGTPKVLFDFREVDPSENWVLTFDDESLWGTEFWTAYSMIIDGETKYNIDIEFPTWTDVNSKDWAYIYKQIFPKGKTPQNSFEIPKGTVLTNKKTGDLLVVAETLKVTNENGVWKSNNPVVIPDVTNDIRIKYDRFEGTGFYVDVEIVAGPDKGKNVADVYGSWKTPAKGKIVYTRNGSDEKMNVLWSPCNENEIYISGDYQHYINELTHFTILEDTVVKPQDAEYSQVPMRVVNEVKIQKYEEYGIWAEVGKFTDKTVFNDIKLSLVNSDGRGFYLKSEIVAGPDKGKDITSVYGEWVTPSPSGNMYYTATGNCFEENMIALWSTCNKNQIYISGSFQNFIDDLDFVRFAKNTVIIPASDKYSQIPMRTVNELSLEREPVYGLWGLEGKVTTPTKFYDVTVDVKNIRGHKLVLSVKPANKSGKSIADVYGNYSSLYGAVTLTEPGKGEYVEEKTVYTIENSTFIMYDILPAVKDKIEIKAGTVLLMHAGCKSSVPVRIVNNLSLTRDADDDWKHVKGAKVTFTNSNSPQTGDSFPIGGYVIVFAVSVFVIAALWFERRRRLYGKDN